MEIVDLVQEAEVLSSELNSWSRKLLTKSPHAESLLALTLCVAKNGIERNGAGDVTLDLFNAYDVCIRNSMLSKIPADIIKACWSIGYLVKKGILAIDADLCKIVNQMIWRVANHQVESITRIGPNPYGLILLSLWSGDDSPTRFLLEESIIRFLCKCHEQLGFPQNGEEVDIFTLYYIKRFCDRAYANGIFPHKCNQISKMLLAFNITDDAVVVNKTERKIGSIHLKSDMHSSVGIMNYITECARLSNFCYDSDLFLECMRGAPFLTLQHLAMSKILDEESKAHICLACIDVSNRCLI